MKFNLKDLEAFNLHKNKNDALLECLEIFNDDKFYLTPIEQYFKGELSDGQRIAKEFKIKFAQEAFDN